MEDTPDLVPGAPRSDCERGPRAVRSVFDRLSERVLNVVGAVAEPLIDGLIVVVVGLARVSRHLSLS